LQLKLSPYTLSKHAINKDEHHHHHHRVKKALSIREYICCRDRRFL